MVGMICYMNSISIKTKAGQIAKYQPPLINSTIYVFLLPTPPPCPHSEAQTSLNSCAQINHGKENYLIPANITSVSPWPSFTGHSWIMRKQEPNPIPLETISKRHLLLCCILYLCRLFLEMIMQSDFCGHQIRASPRAKHRMALFQSQSWPYQDPAQLPWLRLSTPRRWTECGTSRGRGEKGEEKGEGRRERQGRQRAGKFRVGLTRACKERNTSLTVT